MPCLQLIVSQMMLISMKWLYTVVYTKSLIKYFYLCWFSINLPVLQLMSSSLSDDTGYLMLCFYFFVYLTIKGGNKLLKIIFISSCTLVQLQNALVNPLKPGVNKTVFKCLVPTSQNHGASPLRRLADQCCEEK